MLTRVLGAGTLILGAPESVWHDFQRTSDGSSAQQRASSCQTYAEDHARIFRGILAMLKAQPMTRNKSKQPGSDSLSAVYDCKASLRIQDQGSYIYIYMYIYRYIYIYMHLHVNRIYTYVCVCADLFVYILHILLELWASGSNLMPSLVETLLS